MKKTFLSVIMCLSFASIYSEENIDKVKALYDTGDEQGAFELLVPLYAAHPDDPAVNYYLGMIYSDQEQPNLALDFFLKTASVDGRYAYVSDALAITYFQLGDFEGAAVNAKKSIDDYPDKVNSYLILAALLILANQQGDFSLYLTEAAQMDSITVLAQADRFMNEYNRPDLAVNYYEVLDMIMPDDPGLLFRLGSAYEALGDDARAFQNYRSAYFFSSAGETTFDPIFARYMRSLLKQGDYLGVRDDAFAKAGPSDPDSYLYVALSYFMEKNDELFRDNANRYFTLKNETPPRDLKAWAAALLAE